MFPHIVDSLMKTEADKFWGHSLLRALVRHEWTRKITVSYHVALVEMVRMCADMTLMRLIYKKKSPYYIQFSCLSDYLDKWQDIFWWIRQNYFSLLYTLSAIKNDYSRDTDVVDWRSWKWGEWNEERVKALKWLQTEFIKLILLTKFNIDI